MKTLTLVTLMTQTSPQLDSILARDACPLLGDYRLEIRLPPPYPDMPDAFSLSPWARQYTVPLPIGERFLPKGTDLVLMASYVSASAAYPQTPLTIEPGFIGLGLEVRW
jgi:hypothetical protein